MGLFKKIIAIDLGTNNTLGYIPGEGIVFREPTVVAVIKEENKVKAIGYKAKEMLGRTPDDISVHNPIESGVIKDKAITESLVHYFIREAVGGMLTILKPTVVVSMPTSITSTQRRALVEVVKRSGAGDVFPVPETVAAAVGVGLAIDDLKGHMVANIGGGVTDIAVISLAGIVGSSSTKSAGNELDAAITDYIERKYALVISNKDAEKVKKTIASALPVQKEDVAIVKGTDASSGLPRTIKVSTNELVAPMTPVLKNIIEAIAKVLQQTPPELASDVIDRGIVMTGGGSKLNNISELVAQSLHVPAKAVEEPEYAVIRGLGTLAEQASLYKKMVLSKY